MPYPYQKQVWRENRNRIIQLLNEKPLTFKDLIEKSGLSRAVVNQHLKKLKGEGLTKKIYESGKILNVLQVTKINLVEWFLSQLEGLNIPKEVVEKGRNVLNEKVLIFSIAIYFKVWQNMLKISEHLSQETNRSLQIMTFSIIPSKSIILALPSISIPGARKRKWVKHALRELNPYSFNVALIIYQLEKTLHTNIEWTKEAPEELSYSNMPEYLKRDFDNAQKWWLKEISEYLPSSRFFQAITIIYFNTLLMMNELPTDISVFNLSISQE